MTRVRPAGGRAAARRVAAARPYMFLAPAAAFALAFFGYPLVTGVKLSLESASSLQGGPFVGIGNYTSVLSSGTFDKALLNNTEFFAGSVLVLTPVAFLLALCLYSKRSVLRGGVRLLLLLPLSTSTVVVAIIFSQLYNGRYGLYDYWLGKIGLPQINWLTSPDVVMVALIVLAMWGFTGLNVAFFLAGLHSVPPEEIEAARLDGAGWWRVVHSVILPHLRGIGLFVLIQAVVGSYQLFARPDVLTGGGPENASFTVVYYVYQEALQNFNLGASAAAGLILMLVIMLLSGLALVVTSVEFHWLRYDSRALKEGGSRRAAAKSTESHSR